ncbi:hypothetical protein L210DRAFT_3349873, partial [Boletus edulis BED1]
AWVKANDTLLGNVNLYLAEPIRAKHAGKTDATDLLKVLKDEYSEPGLAGAYALFKELLDVKIPHTSHPMTCMKLAENLFTRLTAAGFDFPAKIQAMLLLAKLPGSMDVVAQMIV